MICFLIKSKIYFILSKNQILKTENNYIRCINTITGKQEKSLVNCVEFANLQLGRKIKNYVYNNKGELIICTEKGLLNTKNIFKIYKKRI